jgi:hypothetical protein
LVDEHADQETTLAASEEFGGRRKALASALSVLNNRERRIFEARRLAEEPITLKELADEFGVSRERVRQIVLVDGRQPVSGGIVEYACTIENHERVLTSAPGA